MEIEEFVSELKPFSKIFIFGSLVCGILIMTSVIDPVHFVLLVPGDLWNPFKYFTSIFFFPKIGMNQIMQLIFFYYTSNALEKSYLPHRYGEFLYMLIFLFLGNYLITIPFSWNNYVIVRKSLTLSLTYLFCRKFPNSTIVVFFVIKLKAIYFIWF